MTLRTKSLLFYINPCTRFVLDIFRKYYRVISAQNEGAKATFLYSVYLVLLIK